MLPDLQSRDNPYSQRWCAISDDSCDHRPHPIATSCCANCGGNFEVENQMIFVQNPVSGQTGNVHLSCFEAHDDVLEVC